MELKSSWYTVIVIASTLVAWSIMQTAVGFPASTAALALLGFLGFTPILFRKSKDEMDLDERDISIVRRATLAGAMAAYLALVVTATTIWYMMYSQGKDKIDLGYLGVLVWISGMTLWLVRSLYIILQYPRQSPES